MGEFSEVHYLSGTHPTNFCLRLVSSDPLLLEIRETMHNVIGRSADPAAHTLAARNMTPQVT
jgi:hypothetical protein